MIIKKTISNFVLTTSLAILFFSVVLYFSGVIADAKFNIAEWREEVRITISILFFVFITVGSIASFDYFFGEENNIEDENNK